MRILVLLKRISAFQDIVARKFGRQVELFSNMKGVNLEFFCADPTVKKRTITKLRSVKTILDPINNFGMYKFSKSAERYAKKGGFDVIFPTNDPLLGILGLKLSSKLGLKLAYDLQDNYDYYAPNRIPPLRWLEHKAVRKADIVFTVSDTLKSKIDKIREKKTVVIQNGVDLKLFKPMKKEIARKKLGLDNKKKLIVHTGSLSKDKGVEVLASALQKLRSRDSSFSLLQSGPVNPSPEILKKHGAIFMGLPKRTDVVQAINAADCTIIPSTVNPFSNYAFPYKTFEFMACNVPLVATEVGDFRKLKKKFKIFTCTPGNSDNMAKSIDEATKAKVDYRKFLSQYSWENLARKIQREIEAI